METGFRAVVVAVLTTACQPSHLPGLDLGTAGDKAELFGEGIISTNLYERDMAVSADGDEIVYTLGNYTQTLRCLVSIRKENGKWNKPEVLPFSGRFNDIEPFFAPGGNLLFFASNRPVDPGNASERNDYNIWYVERKSSGWNQPVALDTVINTDGDEFYPSVSNSRSLYFTAQREGGHGREDIWVSRFSDGRYQMAVPLDTAVNSETFEFNAYVSPAEDLIVFSSYGRADDIGGGDLYFSVKNKEGNWEKARNIGPEVNSDALDYCPFIDFPRKTFYFTSKREADTKAKRISVDGVRNEANGILNGMGNIFRIKTDALAFPKRDIQ
jgi:hypothetical protein